MSATPDPGQAPESEPERSQPALLSMMGLVAATVAVVILVFFAVGYLFGRLFL